MDKKSSASPSADTNRKLTKTTTATSETSQLPPLPTEIWISIFEHLRSNQLLTMRLVSRHWRNIINGSPRLLAKLTVTFPAQLTICSAYQPDNLPPAGKVHFRNVTINAIGSWWIPFGKCLTEIKMSSFSEVAQESLLQMLSHTPNLKCFEFIDSEVCGERAFGDTNFRLDKLEKLILRGIEDAAIVEVFRDLCSGLKSLRVTWDWFTHGQIVSPQEMAAFLGGFQSSLEDLYIICTDGTLGEVTKLDRLKLRKLTLVGDDQDNNLGDNLTGLFRMQSSLEYLKIKEIITFDESNHSLLCKIGQTLPNLNFLQITGTHVDFAFLYNYPKVQTLKLFCDWHTSVTIQFNGDDHLNLKELQLKKIHFEDSCLQQILPKMSNLHSMSLNWCTFSNWSDLLEALKSLKQLKTLSLNGVNVNESADYSLNDDFAMPLTRLLLSHCEMSPRLLATVLSGCVELRELRLQSMKLNENSGLGSGLTAVEVICRKLSRLDVLIVKECVLSAEGADLIRGSCKSLKELQITGSL